MENESWLDKYKPAKLKDIIVHLEETYCQSIGIEYMYIRKPEELAWIREKIELKNRAQFNKDENGHDKDSKELFPQIPTVLVIDFFASNSIDNFTLNKDSHVILKATGIDAVQWSYILIPPYSNS
jgi:hypothetical protein